MSRMSPLRAGRQPGGPDRRHSQLQHSPLLPRRPHDWPRLIKLALVVATMGVVHAPGDAAAGGAARRQTAGLPFTSGPTTDRAAQRVPLAELPAAVLDMREAILAAVGSGRIDDLRLALDWNELPPELGIEGTTDPLAHWRATSRDGEGLEILAALADILAGPPALLPIGQDHENNAIYVWPALAEVPVAQMSASEKVEVFRLMPPEDAATTLKRGRWAWYRLSIGADGTWHTFSKDAAATDAAQTGKPGQ